MFTVGSLFDGSGGFPLAAFMCGGVPVWASEIEPYPIAVTKSRFPYVKHLGSVTDIKGNEIDPVDVITFGSPCQDLSVAGLRKGLKHEDNGDDETTRSGLFMEAVRIAKEMREATGGKYPRILLWENVTGAFSSNKGEDFRVVCEELIKIVEPSAVMPPVPKAGWAYADCYCGDGWSLAYRTLDSQYWGVPQRRKRIFLVVDLGGERAGEILFKRDGLRGYFEEGRTPWQGASGDATDSAGATNCEAECVTYVGSFLPQKKAEAMGWSTEDVSCTLHNGACAGFQNGVVLGMVDSHILDDQGGSQITVRGDGKCPTLRAEAHGNLPCVMEAAGFKELNSAKARSDAYESEVAPCLSANKHDASVCVKCVGVMATSAVNAETTDGSISPCLMARAGTGGNQLPLVAVTYDARGNGDGDTVSTITGDHENRITDYTSVVVEPRTTAYGIGNGQANQSVMEERTGALNCMHDQQAVVYADAERIQYIVRRLTPTECARLQGFPDDWGHPDVKTEFTDEEYEFWRNVHKSYLEINGKEHKIMTRDRLLRWYNKLHTDSSEYKMWGNGIALPCALYVMQGIAEVLR